ncbi:hypothetical protein D8B26_000972 [Coccidioides posadasii str. Silveira]|uniref:3-demethylubiquinone-9 3-methyltransferase n=2 Tax=Coccidioides posadasii TaxID=199306 RepID=E9CUJ1_COCPS|nr:3-demethylubiquinone-9 3-methyltransferase family protein [Coccidioides posadasii C735 delta SOWgp]EER28754.1 3-demethylubiquinone-9 3-methyltransferase family protein [Coccidioides posadasii C735 delta SOWgp]EFW22326.1 3-demethylubiquinone-9 3-methyltransferase [Coccidioides posadasii str. Silveira]QVM06259.1 hypothetical protein D8B26_000972 [Coccidioides posadasii str. Silveira]|eukprot:XP_003070899.1 3-demethylubiquinone-9 3-methyltransferase family protein [Coccidioides posadasii C735 delta SOWgp]
MAPKEGSHIVHQKVHPCLWFDTQAVEAATYYTTLFSQRPNAKPGDAADVSRITSIAEPLVTFMLSGQEYSALNGGPHYTHSPAVSLFITCEDQAEVDYFWENFLKDGGKEIQCGWITDKFGVSWQVVPKALMEMLSDEDKEKQERARQTMLNSKKLEIARLKAAFEGRE